MNYSSSSLSCMLVFWPDHSRPFCYPLQTIWSHPSLTYMYSSLIHGSLSSVIPQLDMNLKVISHYHLHGQPFPQQVHTPKPPEHGAGWPEGFVPFLRYPDCHGPPPRSCMTWLDLSVVVNKPTGWGKPESLPSLPSPREPSRKAVHTCGSHLKVT